MFAGHQVNHRTHRTLGIQTFAFIHKHNTKGPVMNIPAANLEAARRKLEHHVPNAEEWTRYKPAEHGEGQQHHVITSMRKKA